MFYFSIAHYNRVTDDSLIFSDLAAPAHLCRLGCHLSNPVGLKGLTDDTV